MIYHSHPMNQLRMMGACKYCGKDAGWFSKKHKECEERHLQGLNDLGIVLNKFFTQKILATDIVREKRQLMTNAYLSEEDICIVSDQAIRKYVASIHRPFSPQSMHLMDDFLNAIGVSYSKINSFGAIDEFTKKLLCGFMVEYFTDQLDLHTAHSRCEKILAKFPMIPSSVEDAYFHVLNKAVTNFLRNSGLTDADQQKIDDYVRCLSLPLNNLPAAYQNSAISKTAQLSIVKNFQRGIIPHTNFPVPIILGKNEYILWTYNDVSLYQEKITKEWIGRSQGMSFRVMKGVYYRVGKSKGHPVEHSSMDFQGKGTLYVTNKNLIFYSEAKSIKIPFNKIVGITPYSDGIAVHKDGTSQRQITLQGFDPWLIMNLLPNISRL